MCGCNAVPFQATWVGGPHLSDCDVETGCGCSCDVGPCRSKRGDRGRISRKWCELWEGCPPGRERRPGLKA